MRAHAWIAESLFCLLVCGCASQVEFPSFFEEREIAGELYRPSGEERRPAVVLLGPCSGVAPYMTGWAAWLKAQGYVALIVDSYRSRGTSNVCEGGSPHVMDVSEDALAALRYLKTLPIVDYDRVAVMGWSHGGSAALELEELSRSYGAAAAASIIAVYPGCETLTPHVRKPTLLLLAGSDDWTPPTGCLSLGEPAKAEGRPLFWKVYQDASHFFDEPAEQREYLGHVLKYDPAATADARAQVRRFLFEKLNKQL